MMISTSTLPNVIATFCITFFFLALGVLSSHPPHPPAFENIPVPSGGAHNYAFDPSGKGPYTSVADGRILLYQKSRKTFRDFAFTSPNRMKALCDGVRNLTMLSTCGRALSMAFYSRTGDLYIADATLGLFVVRSCGGKAKQLATSADGVPFHFTVGLDVDQVSGDVYFTDASSQFGLDQVLNILVNSDSTGRLLKYEPKKKRVSVLLNGISGAAGVAISKDRSFLLLTEFVTFRVLKYWLRGPRAKTTEIIMNVTGIPDNIRTTESGDFWVAVTTLAGELKGMRINGIGTILETLTFSPQFQAQTIAEVHQFKDSIYLGSLMGDSMGIYKT